ncbi:MAG: elongation factor G [Planctomycetota bacterium]|nr:elongation factor G [Planctomycetota bacterium]
MRSDTQMIMPSPDMPGAVRKVINAHVEYLRNIGVTAHIDAGKTTVSERILFYTGKQHKMGEVHEGTATMDYLPEERERGITITAAATSCKWRCQRLEQVFDINLIDTPGHVDFTAEVERSLRVLDGDIVVFAGVEGVEAQSETVWLQADRYGVPRLCFVNKMDRVGADFRAVCSQIGTRLGAKGYPIQMPVGKEDAFRGVIDLVHMCQYEFDQITLGKEWSHHEIDPEYLAEARKRREELFHLVADADDQVGMLLLEGKEPTNDQLRDALRRITLTGQHFPILCGAAYKYIGIQPLLDAVAFYLPSPNEAKPAIGIVPARKNAKASHGAPAAAAEAETTEMRLPLESEPFAGLAFKIIFDAHGDLTFVRVYSGTLRTGARLANPRRGKREKVGQLFLMHADERERIETAGPGDIVAVGGLKDTFTGDTLCDEEHPITLEAMKFPDTVISMAIEPKTNAEKEKLAQALVKLSKEDPTFTHNFNNETGQLISAGMGELHLEIIKSKMLREHNVDANVGSPRVSYRETITRAAGAEGRFIQQTGGHGQYAVVRLRIERFPNDDEDHIVFESEITGGAIPREFIRPVEAGVRAAAKGGILGTGYPMINIKVTLYDGRYHEVDSSELAFQMAGTLGFKEAARTAGAILLEPIMALEVVTPEEYMGNIIGDLNSRRAEIHDVGTRGHLKVIHARVPLAEMFQYATHSRSLSQGRATYTMEPHGYQAVPRQRYKQILGEDFEG